MNSERSLSVYKLKLTVDWNHVATWQVGGVFQLCILLNTANYRHMHYWINIQRRMRRMNSRPQSFLYWSTIACLLLANVPSCIKTQQCSVKRFENVSVGKLCFVYLFIMIVAFEFGFIALLGASNCYCTVSTTCTYKAYRATLIYSISINTKVQKL